MDVLENTIEVLFSELSLSNQISEYISGFLLAVI